MLWQACGTDLDDVSGRGEGGGGDTGQGSCNQQVVRLHLLTVARHPFLKHSRRRVSGGRCESLLVMSTCFRTWQNYHLSKPHISPTFPTIQASRFQALKKWKCGPWRRRRRGSRCRRRGCLARSTPTRPCRCPRDPVPSPPGPPSARGAPAGPVSAAAGPSRLENSGFMSERESESV